MTSEQTAVAPRRVGPTPRLQRVLAGLSGIVAGIVTLGGAEVVSLFLGGIGNPLLSVGSFVIDIVPAGVKSTVIALFGTGDKIVLAAVLLVVVLVLAIVAGRLQYLRSPFGLVLLAAIGVFAAVTVVTRADAASLSIAPTIVGVVLGLIVLRLLAIRLRAWAGPQSRAEALKDDPRRFERRRFLQLIIAAGAVSAVVGAGARAVNAASQAASAARAALKLPRATSPAPVIPPTGQLDVPGISPFVVPNADFYRIDTALQVPSIDPTSWQLKIIGMVEEEVTIDYAELIALPLIERYVTLSCVSQEVGGDLVGNAKWLGYPIRDLLARAKPKAGADMVLSRSQDGFTAGSPLAVLQDTGRDALLAVGMNGEPLPLKHGFPARLVVPGLYGYVSATKWVTELKVTTFAEDQGYWTPRGWSAKGPTKLSSRIDTPSSGTRVEPGTVPLAGVAWSPHVGVSKVEVRIDGGAWTAAELASVVTVDSWLQWVYRWPAKSGRHEIEVRATDTDGKVQSSADVPPAPNGSEGLHTISINVA